jgi:serine/threonine protein kinase
MTEPTVLQSTLSGQRYQLGRSLRIGPSLMHEATDAQARRCWIMLAPAGDDAAIARLRSEATLLGKLQHERLIRLLDRGRSPSWFFLALEPAPGRPLPLLAESGPLPLPLAFSIAVQLAELLAYLHGQGIICRTLPPDSLYVDHVGRAALVDLSAAWDQAAPPVGEPPPNARYLSPEEVGGAAVERASDMYIYGVLVFELLAGQPPFQGATRGDLALQHLLEPAPDVRALRPDVPPELAGLLARCLAKAPAQRPAGPAALLTELHALDRQPPVAATDEELANGPSWLNGRWKGQQLLQLIRGRES